LESGQCRTSDQLYVTTADLPNEVGWLGCVSPFDIL
jgi:hypothetical protein